MESDELRHLDLLGFDEKAETWFIDTSETARLALTRSTLTALVQLYNRIHHGSPLLLTDQKALRQIKEENTRRRESAPELRQPIDQGRPRSSRCRVTRLLARIVPSLLRHRLP